MSVYLVTGASRGLGLEFIKQLLETNTPNKVIASTRSKQSDDSALVQLQKRFSDRLTLIQLDVDSAASVKAAAAEVAKKFDHIDYLINNAGVGTIKPADLLTPEELLADLTTNAVGVFRVVKEFLPLVKKSQKKVIVGLSSILSSISLAGKVVGPFAAYRPSKAALNALFATLQEEYKKDGISFITIHPGWVETDLGNKIGTPPLKAPESIKGVLEVIHKHKAGDAVQLLNYDGTTFACPEFRESVNGLDLNGDSPQHRGRLLSQTEECAFEKFIGLFYTNK